MRTLFLYIAHDTSNATIIIITEEKRIYGRLCISYSLLAVCKFSPTDEHTNTFLEMQTIIIITIFERSSVLMLLFCIKLKPETRPICNTIRFFYAWERNKNSMYLFRFWRLSVNVCLIIAFSTMIIDSDFRSEF